MQQHVLRFVESRRALHVQHFSKIVLQKASQFIDSSRRCRPSLDDFQDVVSSSVNSADNQRRKLLTKLSGLLI